MRIINLDLGSIYYDSLGRVVIDLDAALAQTRMDAEKIYVKDPRVKSGGYYRTIKGGGKPSKKRKLSGADKALQVMQAAALVGSIGASGLAISNIVGQKVKQRQREKEAEKEIADRNAKFEKEIAETEEKLRRMEEEDRQGATSRELDREFLRRRAEAKKAHEEMPGLWDETPEEKTRRELYEMENRERRKAKKERNAQLEKTFRESPDDDKDNPKKKKQ